MIELSKPQFARLVRDALTNLYDPARIETHPLLDVLVDARAPHETKGLRLREVLTALSSACNPPRPSLLAAPNGSAIGSCNYVTSRLSDIGDLPRVRSFT
jgi:hypothetical protein